MALLNFKATLSWLLFCCFVFFSTALVARKPVHVDPSIKLVMDSADVYLKTQNDSCLIYYKKCLSLVEAFKPVDYEDYLLYKLGRGFYYFEMQDSAKKYLDLALEIALKNNNAGSQADIFNVIGTSFYMQGALDSALFYMIKSAEQLAIVGDSTYLAYAWSNIGLTLSTVYNFDEAIYYLEKAETLLAALGAREFRSIIGANLALNYYLWGDELQSREKALAVLGDMEESFENNASPIALYTLALSWKGEDLEKALTYAAESVSLSRRMRLRSSVDGDAKLVYAELLLENGQVQRAYEIATEADGIYYENGYPLGRTRSLRLLAQIAGKLNQFRASSEYWEAYVSLNDSLRVESTSKEINRLNLSYERAQQAAELAESKLEALYQKQRTNRLLAGLGAGFILLFMGMVYFRQKQRHEIKRLAQQQEIEVLNALVMGEEQERARISRELHDGVASLVAAALASIRASEGEQLSDIKVAKIEAILEKSHSETRRIAHNLLPLTLELDGLLAAVDEFVSQIEGIGQLSVQYSKSIESRLVLGKHAQLMVYRVLQELVQNVIKHASATELSIHLQQEGRKLRVEVRDNGKGLPAGIPGKGQGLKTLKERLSSVGAELELDSSQSSGMTAVFILENAFGEVSTSS